MSSGYSYLYLAVWYDTIRDNNSFNFDLIKKETVISQYQWDNNTMTYDAFLFPSAQNNIKSPMSKVNKLFSTADLFYSDSLHSVSAVSLPTLESSLPP